MRVDACFNGEYQTEPEVYTSGWSITFVMSEDEVTTLLAAYDPNSGTSPTAAVSREIARPIAEALRQKVLGVIDG